MSVINIIHNEEITLVQGVGGLFFCEESWIGQNRENTCRKKILDKESGTMKNKSDDTECPRTALWDLP